MQGSLDEKAVKGLETEQRDIQNRIDALRIVIDGLDRQHAELRDELDATIKKELAEKIASDHEGNMVAYRDTMSAFIVACRELAAAADKVGEISFAAREIAGFAGSMTRGLPISLEHSREEVRDQVARLRNGSIKPKATTTTTSMQPVHPKIEKRNVFALNQLEWVESDEVRTCAKHTHVQLPLALIEKAMKLGHAIASDHPRVKQLNTRGGVPAPRPGDPANIRIDADDMQPARAVFGRDRAAVAGGLREVYGGNKSFTAPGLVTE